MKTKALQNGINVLNIAIIYLLISSLYLGITAFYHFRFSAIYYIAIIIPIIWNYILRKKIHFLIPYVILGVLPIIVSFVIVKSMENISIIFIPAEFLVYSILNFRFWTNTNRPVTGQPGMLPGLIIVICYIMIPSSEHIYDIVLYAYAVIFVCLIIARKWLSNMLYLGTSGQLTSNMPVKDIYKSSLRATFITTVISGLLMIFIKTDKLITLLANLGYKLKELFILIISSLFQLNPDYSDEVDFTPIDFSNEKTPPQSTYATLIDGIITTVILSVILVLLLRLIIRIIISLLYKNEKTPKEKVITGGGNEKIERLTFFKNRSKAKPPKNNSEKARRIYKKRLLKYRKNGVIIHNMNTPHEHRVNILKSKNEDISIATSIYEKARYRSCEIITDKELNDLKNNLS